MNVPFSGCETSTPPCGKTFIIVKGPDHRDFNFPGKSFSRELNNRTCCPAVNSFSGDVLVMPGLGLLLINTGVLICFVSELIKLTELK